MRASFRRSILCETFAKASDGKFYKMAWSSEEVKRTLIDHILWLFLNVRGEFFLPFRFVDNICVLTFYHYPFAGRLRGRPLPAGCAVALCRPVPVQNGSTVDRRIDVKKYIMIALKLRRSQLSLSNQKKPSKGISRHRVTRPDRSPGGVIQGGRSHWDTGGRSQRFVIWVCLPQCCTAETIAMRGFVASPLSPLLFLAVLAEYASSISSSFKGKHNWKIFRTIKKKVIHVDANFHVESIGEH